MAIKRPDWNDVMKDCGGADPRDNEMVALTRGTLRLAKSALRKQNSEDYYHNYGAAESEADAVLAVTRAEKSANLKKAFEDHGIPWPDGIRH